MIEVAEICTLNRLGNFRMFLFEKLLFSFHPHSAVCSVFAFVNIVVDVVLCVDVLPDLAL